MRFFPIFIISISTAVAVPYLIDETLSTDEPLPADEALQADETLLGPLSELYSDQTVPGYNSDVPIDNIQNPAADQFIAVNGVLSPANYIPPDGANPDTANEILAFDPVSKVLDQMGKSHETDPFWTFGCKNTNGICCTEDLKPAPSPQDFTPIRLQSCATRKDRFFSCGTPQLFDNCDQLNALAKRKRSTKDDEATNGASQPLEITCYSDCP